MLKNILYTITSRIKQMHIGVVESGSFFSMPLPFLHFLEVWTETNHFLVLVYVSRMMSISLFVLVNSEKAEKHPNQSLHV